MFCRLLCQSLRVCIKNYYFYVWINFVCYSNITLLFVYFDTADSDNISIPPPVCTPAQKQKPRRNRQGKSAELTSNKYRTNLLQQVALKDVSNIKKRNKTQQKNQTMIQNILCYKCGDVFSTSKNCEAWTKCCSCFQWFHATCFLECETCK